MNIPHEYSTDVYDDDNDEGDALSESGATVKLTYAI